MRFQHIILFFFLSSLFLLSVQSRTISISLTVKNENSKNSRQFSSLRENIQNSITNAENNNIDSELNSAQAISDDGKPLNLELPPKYYRETRTENQIAIEKIRAAENIQPQPFLRTPDRDTQCTLAGFKPSKLKVDRDNNKVVGASVTWKQNCNL